MLDHPAAAAISMSSAWENTSMWALARIFDEIAPRNPGCQIPRMVHWNPIIEAAVMDLDRNANVFRLKTPRRGGDSPDVHMPVWQGLLQS